MDSFESLSDTFDQDNLVSAQSLPSVQYKTITLRLLLEKDCLSFVDLRLATRHPLWGHFIWNASLRITLYFLQEQPFLCRNRRVIELGAGAGLPSLVAAKQGAQQVICTDYPDRELLDCLSENLQAFDNTKVCGLVWGDRETINSILQENEKSYFDVIIASDLVFNHSQHNSLVQTCNTLSRPGQSKLILAFSHYVEGREHKDMQFLHKLLNPVKNDNEDDFCAGVTKWEIEYQDEKIIDHNQFFIHSDRDALLTRDACKPVHFYILNRIN